MTRHLTRLHVLGIFFLVSGLFMALVPLPAFAQDGTEAASIVEEQPVNTDGDGTTDGEDSTPNGESDTDDIPDEGDNCPASSNPDQADSDGDGSGDACDDTPLPVVDRDGDSFADGTDNCPDAANGDQLDSDGDGSGDACDDTPNGEIVDGDDDGISDEADNCLDAANGDQLDSDGDGSGDACDDTPPPVVDRDGDDISDEADNCPEAANGEQEDTDVDGSGNACDETPNGDMQDADTDSVADDLDTCPNAANADQTDTDGDGVGDACDETPNGDIVDTDGDAIADDTDTCPDLANPEQDDADTDGLGDACDDTPEGDVPGFAALAIPPGYEGIEFSVTGVVTSIQNSSTGVGKIGIVTYTYTVVNNSDALFYPRIDIDGEFNFPCSRKSVGSGGTLACEYSVRFYEADFARGYVTSTATLYDFYDDPQELVSTVETLVNLFDANATGLALTVRGVYVEPDADYPNGSIHYTYFVSVAGQPLSVVVTDVVRGTQVPDCTGPNALANEVYACYATYAVTDADAVAGSVRQIVRATSAQGPASGNALSVVAIPQTAGLSIDKSVSLSTLDLLAYTFDVSNTGDTTLSGVYVVDNRIATSAIDCGVGAGVAVTIPPGESRDCAAQYTITDNDRTAGSVVNIAYATNDETTSDSVMVTYVIQAALNFTKTGKYFNDRPETFPRGYLA